MASSAAPAPLRRIGPTRVNDVFPIGTFLVGKRGVHAILDGVVLGIEPDVDMVSEDVHVG